MFEKIGAAIVDGAVRDYLKSDKFRDVVIECLVEATNNLPANRIPKNAQMFGTVMKFHLIGHYGLSEPKAEETARWCFEELTEAIGPWGHPDSDWTVADAREWVDEMMEDRCPPLSP